MRWDSRDAILARLRKGRPGNLDTISAMTLSQAQPSPHNQTQNIDPNVIRKVMEPLSVTIEFHKDLNGIQSFIGGVLEENNVRTCIAWRHPLLDRLEIPRFVKQQNIQYRDSFEDEKDFRTYCAQADLGITSADAIIEESGTIVLRASYGLERSTSLLPPIHLAVVKDDRAIGSIGDLPALLRSCSGRGMGLPSALHLVTGPSRTADIEFNLVLGVHGPKKVYIIVKR